MERTFGVVLLATSMAATAAWHITDGGRSSQPVRSSVSRSSTSAPTVDRGALTADGDLAFVSEGCLWVLDGKTHALTKVAPSWQRATQPRFSPNGSWLSYLVSSGQVWLARSDGRSPRLVASGGGGSWLPDGELLATTGLWRVSGSGVVIRVGKVPNGLSAWSSDGKRYAFVSDSLVFTKASRAIDRLQVASTLTGKRTTWYESKVFFTKSSGARGTFLDRVLVLPHKEGILFTLDPDLSASLAADGLNLYEIRAPGARPKKLGVTVGWNTVAIGSKGMFAFTDGPNRYAWLTKRVEICSAAREVCTPVPTPDGNISFDPSWSPNGKTLAFVDAPSKQVPNFCQSTLERWYAAHSLWLVKSAGSAPSRIRQAEGASVPIWSANGKSLLYEASDALWLLPTLSGRPVLVASPLFAPNDWPSYEGQIDWSDQFSWRSR